MAFHKELRVYYCFAHQPTDRLDMVSLTYAVKENGRGIRWQCEGERIDHDVELPVGFFAEGENSFFNFDADLYNKHRP